MHCCGRPLPANAPGLTLISREALTSGDGAPRGPALDAGGEENDSLVLFDKVFIPWEYVFSYRNKALGEIYYVLGQFAFWKILTRMSFRAELFAGAAQAIVDALGTDNIAAVRALVAEVVAYAATLRGMIIASVETAEPTISGVMLPNVGLRHRGPAQRHRRIPQDRADAARALGPGADQPGAAGDLERSDIGPLLDEYLPGYEITGATRTACST